MKSCEKDIRTLSKKAWDLLESYRFGAERLGIVALVACLSTEGDLLSQWRGYNGGKGYAIGFNDDWLSQNAERQSFKMLPVIYQAADQKEAAHGVSQTFIKMLAGTNDDTSLIHEVVRNWYVHALKVALACKDEHFDEEHEHRLAYVGEFWPSKLDVRTGASGLIPYLPFRFDAYIPDNLVFEPRNLGIERIIVGPALKDQQMAAVDALLSKHSMRVEIKKSAIPYVAD